MKNITPCFVLLGAAPIVCAESVRLTTESPKSILKIEDFLPEQKKWSISSGVSILNSSNDGGHPGVYINQIAPGQYILDRTSLSYKKEMNGVSGYFSGIYGITDQLSLSTTLNGQWINDKFSSENNESSSKNEYKFNGVGVGSSYQFYRLSDFTLIFGGVTIKNGNISSYAIGSSLNWIYDPLVLNLSFGFLDGISKEKFSNNYNAYTTSGKIIFAVSPEVNLNWGFSKDFIYSKNHYVNSNEWSSTTSLLVGTSVNLMKDLIGVINVKGGVGDNKSSVISVGFSYKI